MTGSSVTLIERLNSGEPIPVSKEYWEEKKLENMLLIEPGPVPNNWFGSMESDTCWRVVFPSMLMVSTGAPVKRTKSVNAEAEHGNRIPWQCVFQFVGVGVDHWICFVHCADFIDRRCVVGVERQVPVCAGSGPGGGPYLSPGPPSSSSSSQSSSSVGSVKTSQSSSAQTKSSSSSSSSSDPPTSSSSLSSVGADRNGLPK